MMIKIIGALACITVIGGIITGCAKIDDTEIYNDIEQTFDVYFYIADDNGMHGKQIGCGDSLTAMQKTIYTDNNIIQEAIQALITADADIYGPFGLSNALENNTLTIHTITTENNMTTIQLQGNIILNGICDNPRVHAQLTHTVGQFFPDNNVKIMLNNILLEEFLSMQ